MGGSDFEGTLVLEQLAAVGLIDDFLDAVDSDDVHRARTLMRRAQVDAATIEEVVARMRAGDGEH